jgi:hypothetical protein
MSYSTLKITNGVKNIVDQSELTTNIFTTNIETTNQIYDYIQNNNFNIGDCISIVGNLFTTASLKNDETMEVVGVIESFSGSMAKIVFDGIVEFTLKQLSLKPGAVYFLTSSMDTSLYRGTDIFRNMTIYEDEIYSKPVMLAVSDKSAFVVNYRGMVNHKKYVYNPYYVYTEPISDCNCDVEGEIYSRNVPELQVKIIESSSILFNVPIPAKMTFDNYINMTPSTSFSP